MKTWPWRPVSSGSPWLNNPSVKRPCLATWSSKCSHAVGHWLITRLWEWNKTLVLLFRLIPILVNGMKYSEIDIILLKVSNDLRTPDPAATLFSAFYTRTNGIFSSGFKPEDSCTNSHVCWEITNLSHTHTHSLWSCSLEGLWSSASQGHFDCMSKGANNITRSHQIGQIFISNDPLCCRPLA